MGPNQTSVMPDTMLRMTYGYVIVVRTQSHNPRITREVRTHQSCKPDPSSLVQPVLLRNLNGLRLASFVDGGTFLCACRMSAQNEGEMILVLGIEDGIPALGESSEPGAAARIGRLAGHTDRETSRSTHPRLRDAGGTCD